MVTTCARRGVLDLDRGESHLGRRMSAADKRIAELLERWLTSLELHSGYLDLDNEAYGRAQAWPPHQRPTRWIIDLARTRTLDLKRLLDERQAHGDTDFADALELMSFLTTLLGSEHVERFIPLAVPSKSGTVVQRAPTAAARPTAPAKAKEEPAPTVARSAETSGTVKVARAPAPQQAAAPNRVIPAARAAPTRVIPAASARTRNEGSPAKTAPRPDTSASARTRTGSTSRAQTTGTSRTGGARNAGASARAAETAATSRGAGTKTNAGGARLTERAVNQVIADAVRMLDWGSEWPQLAGLIARLADRPPEKEVWRILREHRATIDSKVEAKARAG